MLLFIEEKKNNKTAFLFSLSFHKTHNACLFIKEKKKNIFVFSVPEGVKRAAISPFSFLSFPKSLIGNPVFSYFDLKIWIPASAGMTTKSKIATTRRRSLDDRI